MTRRQEERSSEETAITFLSMGPDGPTPPAGFSVRKSGAGRVAAALKAAKESSRTGPRQAGLVENSQY